MLTVISSQIKNMVAAAYALAVYQNTKLSISHLELVTSFSEEFESDFGKDSNKHSYLWLLLSQTPPSMIGGRFEDKRGYFGQSIWFRTKLNLVTHKAVGNSVNVQGRCYMISYPISVRLREL